MDTKYQPLHLYRYFLDIFTIILDVFLGKIKALIPKKVEVLLKIIMSLAWYQIPIPLDIERMQSPFKFTLVIQDKKNVQQPSGGEPLEDTGHIGIKIGINKLDVSAHHGKRRHQKTLVGVDIAIIKMQLKIHHIREHILKTPIKVKTESKPYKEDIEKGG